MFVLYKLDAWKSPRLEKKNQLTKGIDYANGRTQTTDVIEVFINKLFSTNQNGGELLSKLLE